MGVTIRGRRITKSVFVATAAATAVVIASAGFAMARGPTLPWRAHFPAGQQLITNEVAFEHPDRPHVHTSTDWLVTSGSLFADHGTAFTGVVDAEQPDVDSEQATDS